MMIFLYSSPSKLRGSNLHLHQQQQKQEQTPIKLFATLQPQHPNITTTSLLFSFNPRKESPFPKTLIYFRLLQYLISDYFFWELEGAHTRLIATTFVSEPHSSSQEEQTLNTESFGQLSSNQAQWQRT
jgi:hypothetical protein